MRMCIRYKLKEAMDAKGVSQYRLEKLSKVTQATISRILSGETLNPSHQTVKKLAKALGISSSSLTDDDQRNVDYVAQKGIALAVSEPDAQGRQISVGLRSVPVLSNQEIINGSVEKESQRRYTKTELEISDQAFAWEVQSNQLGNMGVPFAIPVTATVIVEPGLKPINGNMVLVVDDNGVLMLKKLEQDGPNLYLHSLNPQHVPIMMTDEYVIKGTVVSINLKTI